MSEDKPAEEEGTEDIVGRLEALRKRAPEGKTEETEETEEGVEEKPLDDRRQRISRIVGIAVIFLVVVGVLFGAYKGIYEPIRQKKIDEARLEQEKKQAFINAQKEKFNEINDAFAGLPSKYTAPKPALLDELKEAKTLGEINSIYVTEPANNAWRGHRKDQLDEKATVTEKLKMGIGNDTYRGYDEIKQKIEQLSYRTLKGVTIQEYSSEYFPIRLTREQAAGGWTEQGNLVNIWLRGETSSLLSRNARVVAVLRGSSSGVISLAESESKTASGGGSEGKGTVSSLSTGGVGSISGTFPASSGYKTAQTQTSFSVDISQIQKAAAASKLPESYIEDVLGNYGVKLNRIEESTGIADFGAMYIILFEVGEEEVPNLVLRASPSSAERTNLFVTIARPSDWIENVP